MIDSNTADYLYQEILTIYNNTDLPIIDKIKLFRTAFRKLIKKITEDENQFFSSNFARIVFILDKYSFPDDLAIQFRKLSTFLSKINKDIKYNSNDINLCTSSYTKLISFFSNQPIPDSLLNLIEVTELRNYSSSHSVIHFDNIDFIRLLVKKKLKPKEIDNERNTLDIVCENEEHETCIIRLQKPWLSIWEIVWFGAVINVFDAKKSKDKNNKTDINGNDITILETSNHTLISLEPDILYDATELSECFQNTGDNKYLFFLKKFNSISTSSSLVAGNIVNYCFDELLMNPDSDFNEVFNKALRVKPLQAIALAKSDKNNIQVLKENVENQFKVLRGLIKNIDIDSFSIEPSFISPKFGLQGRLDVLLTYKDEINRKNVIELKSGNPPKPDYYYLNTEGRIITTGIWNNHFAQVTCYNLLLDSTFQNRTGTSQILYSKNFTQPMRNAPNIIQKKQEILNFRNWIVAYERAISLGQYTIFDMLNKDKIGSIPSYSLQDVENFSDVFNNASQLEKDYFFELLSFVIREIRASKLGSNNGELNYGFSGLWKNTLLDKTDSLDILSWLTIHEENSDFEQLHLTLNKTAKTPLISTIRKGDLCVLYPIADDNEVYPLNQQLFKCSIKSIEENKINISIRNKFSDKSIFGKNIFWVLEHDSIDSLNKLYVESLYDFLRADKNKKELILGLSEPQFNANTNVSMEYLTVNQNEILNKALSAKDYFLIQGPPGTGKTSYMLRAIVETLYSNSKENILILAYTNRAVDEICLALNKIAVHNSKSPNGFDSLDYIRIGSKESTDLIENHLSYLAETTELNDLYKRILKTRVVVTTVASALTNHEIFEIINFDTVIIDEASQILENQIVGLVSKINRFILIGDEKQLPAVVVQSENQTKVENESLKEILLESFSSSLFERLIKTCKIKNWGFAYGMLNQQARMHIDIQEFPNTRFYESKLEPFKNNLWQLSDEHFFSNKSKDGIEQLLSESRLIFINSPYDSISKINHSEAKRTTKIIQTIKNVYKDKFNDKTVGVISPFRAQCAEIIRNLDTIESQNITVDTVERFQGSERDIIIISFAINNLYQLRNIQSMLDTGEHKVDRKLNVAITRAKHHLILLGMADVLSASPILSDLIGHIKKKGKYIESDVFDKLK